MTLLEQIKLNGGHGYDIADASRDEIFVALETETNINDCAEDSCLLFNYWLAGNLEVVHVEGTTAVCKVTELIEAHYNVFVDFCKECNKESFKMNRQNHDDNIEIALKTLENMIPGNYTEKVYDYFMHLLNSECPPKEPMSEEEARKTIESLRSLQERGEIFPCPRCGYSRMDPKAVRNALSRHANVYICSVCGTDEAIRDMVGDVLPLNQWGMVI